MTWACAHCATRFGRMPTDRCPACGTEILFADDDFECDLDERAYEQAVHEHDGLLAHMDAALNASPASVAQDVSADGGASPALTLTQPKVKNRP